MWERAHTLAQGLLFHARLPTCDAHRAARITVVKLGPPQPRAQQRSKAACSPQHGAGSRACSACCATRQHQHAPRHAAAALHGRCADLTVLPCATPGLTVVPRVATHGRMRCCATPHPSRNPALSPTQRVAAAAHGARLGWQRRWCTTYPISSSVIITCTFSHSSSSRCRSHH